MHTFVIQDVAVDGWALTMLKPKNVGYASTCNSVGQVRGSNINYHLISFNTNANLISDMWMVPRLHPLHHPWECRLHLILSGIVILSFWSSYSMVPIANIMISILSADHQDQFQSTFPSNATILISFIQFLLFWGIVFLVTTTLIGDHFYKTFTLFAFGQHWSYNLFSSAIFKREKNSAGASTVGPDGIKLSNTLLMLNCFLLCIFCTHHHHKQYMFRWNHWSRTWTWPSWHL